MTVKEFSLMVKAIQAYFPREEILRTDESIRLWYEELKDLDYRLASMELRKYVALNRFAPTISDIRECLVDFAEEKDLREAEAWNLVLSTMAEVEAEGMASVRFAALPELVRKAVGGREQFLALVDDESANMEVARSNFIKSYAKLLSEELRLRKLQPGIAESVRASGRLPSGGTTDRMEENNR